MLALLVLAQVLSVANANLIAVALPPLSAELGASGTQQQWIVDAYVLVFASLLITAGVLGDRHGRRRALVGGLALFAVASLACALATSPGMLIAARVVQGLGPPLILPASLALLTTAYTDPAARARAIGLWAAGSGLGIAVGPILGGVLVDAFGWRAAFAFNVPAALLIAALVLRVVQRDQPLRDGAREAFDVRGAALVTATLAAAVFALIEGPERGWGATPVLLAALGTVLLVGAFAAAERGSAAPLVDLALVRRPAFAAANLGAATVMFVMLPLTVYLSAFLQGFRGATPLAAGAALLPLGGAVAVAAGISGRLTARLNVRTQVTAGLLTAAAGALLLTGAFAGSTPPDAGDVWVPLLVFGTGAGFALPATTATAVSVVESARTGMASAIHNTGRQLGATLGIAVLGSIVLARAGDARSAADYAAGFALATTVAAAILLAVGVLAFSALRRVPAPVR